LEFSARYTLGSLSASAGQPFFLKTVIGDLDGDGRNDVASFTNATINGSDVVVLYQDQDGTFHVFISINSISDLGLTAVNDIAIGDLNGDGRADLAILGNPLPVTIGNGPQLEVLYQDSNGNLSPPVRYTITDQSFSLGLRMAIGDLNSDGRNDLVFSGSPIRVMLQTPDGTLGTIFDMNALTTFLGEVHIADMDADGRNDIVFQAGDKSIGILRQVAPGVFSNAPGNYPVVTNLAPAFNTFAVGDVNGDGKNDVVVVDAGNSGFLNIFLQNGSGTLDSPQLVTVTDNPLFGIEIADMDKDGRNDIVCDADGQVHVLYQQPDHTFQSSIVYPYPTTAIGVSLSSQALSVGDVNGDGWPDAVLSWIDEGFFVLWNTAR